jgi:glyoxylase-like metal-dependent hydrolase (beta-lactamase superfamily II)
VLVTHADTDHSGRLDAILEALRPKRVIVPPAAAFLSPDAETATAGDVLFVRSIRVDVFGPRKSGAPRSSNESGLITLVHIGPTTTLVTGDAEDEGLKAALPFLPQRVDALWLPHHGSHAAALPELLDRTRPGSAIAAGRPAALAPETRMLLEALGIPLLEVAPGRPPPRVPPWPQAARRDARHEKRREGRPFSGAAFARRRGTASGADQRFENWNERRAPARPYFSTFLHARIAREESVLAHRGFERRVEPHEGAGEAHRDRRGLAVRGLSPSVVTRTSYFETPSIARSGFNAALRISTSGKYASISRPLTRKVPVPGRTRTRAVAVLRRPVPHVYLFAVEVAKIQAPIRLSGPRASGRRAYASGRGRP